MSQLNVWFLFVSSELLSLEGLGVVRVAGWFVLRERDLRKAQVHLSMRLG